MSCVGPVYSKIITEQWKKDQNQSSSKDETSKWFSVANGAHCAGKVLSLMLVSVLATRNVVGQYGWRLCYCLTGYVWLMVAVVVFFFMTKTGGTGGDSQATTGNNMGFASKKTFWVMACVMYTSETPFVMLGYMVMYFQYSGLSNKMAGFVGAVIQIGAVAGSCTGGYAAQECHKKWDEKKGYGRFTFAMSVLALRFLAVISILCRPIESGVLRWYHWMELFVFGLTLFVASAVDRPTVTDIADKQGALAGSLFRVAGGVPASATISPIIALLAERFGYIESKELLEDMDIQTRMANVNALRMSLMCVGGVLTVLNILLYTPVFFTYGQDKGGGSGTPGRSGSGGGCNNTENSQSTGTSKKVEYPWHAIVLYHVFTFLDAYSTQSLYVCMGAFEVDLALSPSSLSVIATAHVLFELGLSPLWGYLVDNKESHYVECIAMLIIGTTSILLACTSSYPLILVLRFFHGASLGCTGPVIQKIITGSRCDSEQATWFGIYAAVFGLGSLIGCATNSLLSMKNLLGLYGWRLSYCILGYAWLLTAPLVFYFMSPNPGPNQSSDSNSGKLLDKLKCIFQVPSYWLLVAVMFASEAAYAFMAYIPLYLQYSGLSEMAIASLCAVVVFGGMFGGLFGGKLIDWRHKNCPEHGRLGFAVVALGVRLIHITLLMWWPIPATGLTWQHYAEAFIVGTTLVTIHSVDRPMLDDVVQKGSEGTALSFLRMIAGVPSSLCFPPLIANMAERVYDYVKGAGFGEGADRAVMASNANALRRSIMYIMIGATAVNVALYVGLFFTYKGDKTQSATQAGQQTTTCKSSTQTPASQTNGIAYPWPSVVLYHVVSFINAYDTQILSLSMRALEASLGLSASSLSIMASMEGMTLMGFAPVWGYLLTRFDCQYVCAAGMVLCGISCILLAQVTTFSWILLIRLTHGIGLSCAAPVAVHIIAANWGGNKGGTTHIIPNGTPSVTSGPDSTQSSSIIQASHVSCFGVSKLGKSGDSLTGSAYVACEGASLTSDSKRGKHTATNDVTTCVGGGAITKSGSGRSTYVGVTYCKSALFDATFPTNTKKDSKDSMYSGINNGIAILGKLMCFFLTGRYAGQKVFGHSGWRLSYAVVGCVWLFAALPVCLYMTKTGNTTSGGANNSAAGKLKETIQKSKFWAMTVVMFFSEAPYVIMGYMVMYLQYSGLSTIGIGSAIIVMQVGTAIGSVSGGFIAGIVHQAFPQYGRLAFATCALLVRLIYFVIFLRWPLSKDGLTWDEYFLLFVIGLTMLVSPTIEKPIVSEISNGIESMTVPLYRAIGGMPSYIVFMPLLGWMAEKMYGYVKPSGDVSQLGRVAMSVNANALRKCMMWILSIVTILNIGLYVVVHYADQWAAAGGQGISCGTAAGTSDSSSSCSDKGVTYPLHAKVLFFIPPFIQGVNMEIPPICMHAFEVTLGLSPSRLSWIPSVQFMFFLGCSPLWGLLLDMLKLNVANVQCIAMCICGISSILMAYVSHYPLVLLLTLLNSCGNAATIPVSSKIIGEDKAMKDNTTLWFGVYWSIYYVGALVSDNITVILSMKNIAGVYGWRVCYCLGGYLWLVIAAPVFFWMKSSDKQGKGSGGGSVKLSDILCIMRKPTFWLTGLIIYTSFVALGLMAYLTMYLQNSGFSDSLAGFAASVVMMGVTFGSATGGFMTDYIHKLNDKYGKLSVGAVTVFIRVVVMMSFLWTPITGGTLQWYHYICLFVYGTTFVTLNAIDTSVASDIAPTIAESLTVSLLEAIGGIPSYATITPMIGYLCEKKFGYVTSTETGDPLPPEVMANNVSALRKSMLIVFVVCSIINIALYLVALATYGKDKVDKTTNTAASPAPSGTVTSPCPATPTTTTPSTGSEVKYPLHAKVLCFVPAFVQGVNLQLLPICMRAFEITLGLSPSRLSWIPSVQIMFYLGISPLWGLLLDNLNRKVGHVQCIATCLCGISCILLGYVSHYPLVMLFTVLNACGNAACIAVAPKMITEDNKMQSKKTLWFGVNWSLYCIGALITSNITVSLSMKNIGGVYGWRVCHCLVGYLWLAVAAPIFFWMKKADKPDGGGTTDTTPKVTTETTSPGNGSSSSKASVVTGASYVSCLGVSKLEKSGDFLAGSTYVTCEGASLTSNSNTGRQTATYGVTTCVGGGIFKKSESGSSTYVVTACNSGSVHESKDSIVGAAGAGGDKGGVSPQEILCIMRKPTFWLTGLILYTSESPFVILVYALVYFEYSGLYKR